MLILLTAVVAHAEDPNATRAQELFENGSELYNEGRYEAAIVAFREANAIYPAPELYYNLANCYERLGQLREAVAQLDLYRATATAEEKPVLERRIAALTDRIQMTPATPAPAVVSSGPALPPASPAPSTLETRHTPRWWLVGAGAGLVAAGGTGAGVFWYSSQEHVETGDRAAYDEARILNGASFGVGGLGVVLAGLGFLLPVEQTVTVSTLEGGATVALGGRW